MARWLFVTFLVPPTWSFSLSALRFRVAPLTKLRSSPGDDSWLQALREAEGKDIRRDFFGTSKDGASDPTRDANRLLITWLEENGVYVSELSTWGKAPHPLGLSSETYDENNDNEKSGRGLIARKSINAGDQLFSIPLSLCLTKAAARRELGKTHIPAGTSEYIAIALLLIHERYIKKEASFWFPYINILPDTEEVNPSYCWSDDEIMQLEGSPAVLSTRSLQAKLKAEYAELFAPEGIFSLNPESFPGADASMKGSGPYSFSNFEWAFTMLFSRAIRLEKLSEGAGAVALVPYADLINHSPFSTAYISAKAAKSNFFGRQDEDSVVLFADRSFKQMEQLYISYGQKSNAELLLLYGFSLERNPFNSVEISFGLKRDEVDDPTGRLYDHKLRFLQTSGRGDASGSGLMFPLFGDRYPNELLECLRLLCLRTDDVLQSNGVLKPIKDLQLNMQLSIQNEEAALESIIDACKIALNRYPTTEEEDAASMNNRNMFSMMPMSSRNAIRLRRTERRLLLRTIANTEKRIIELQGGEVEVSRPWLDKKSALQYIVDDIGIELK